MELQSKFSKHQNILVGIYLIWGPAKSLPHNAKNAKMSAALQLPFLEER